MSIQNAIMDKTQYDDADIQENGGRRAPRWRDKTAAKISVS
ncbi:hypothetical protein CLOSTASPAR_05252 [[Clostridium] asparagiforme DSM 15981]|uniref:Uncharacterized protein n=1 Tax=[Clostridium] asparagiforme DSM 15981 TaxID=518636 RepID=C0D7K5_9FIRM|nr:hypothetical protein CLOSTASPAR_05252 [[Clostridium] asparagiforme DSM 15981]